MNRPTVARLWNYGLFPVLAAATFQLAVIYRARTDLAEFFFAQSIFAVGTSFVCLQPRTWQRSLRTSQRLRWSFIFTVVFLAGCGGVLLVRPSELVAILGVFLLKKVCDAAREYFYLTVTSTHSVVLVMVTSLELAGVLFVILDSLNWALLSYGLGSGILFLSVLFVSRADAWDRPSWVRHELFTALVMTLFNMGSRLFLVSTNAVNAHVAIGSMLQVLNFSSPITYTIFSRKHTFVSKLIGAIVIGAVIFGGSVALMAIGGGVEVSLVALVVFSILLTASSGFVISFMNSASAGERHLLGWAIAPWVVIASLGASIALIPWEIAYIVFLSGNLLIVSLMQMRRGSSGVTSDQGT